MKKVTARTAYAKSVEIKMKHEKRGYGHRVVFVNQCPECGGQGRMDGHECYCCANEPDNPTGLVKHGGRWYRSL